ncbi:MAG: hypothetical protein ABI620_04500 [Chloroflexota bacterium]
MGPQPFPAGGLGSFDPAWINVIKFVGAVLLVYFINVAVVGWLARRKGRDDGVWAVLALFTGPFALVAILLKKKQAAPPEAEVERLAIEQASHLHLRSDTELELEVAGRPVWLPGELTARVKGHPAFVLAASHAWRWSDGLPVDDEVRIRLLRELPRIGKRDGWVLQLHGDDLAPMRA